MTTTAKLGVALFVCGAIFLVYWLLSPPTKPFLVFVVGMTSLCVGARLARKDLLRPIKFVCERYAISAYQMAETDARLISPAVTALLCLFVAVAFLKAPAPGPFGLIGVGLLLFVGATSLRGVYKAFLQLKSSSSAWLAMVLYGALFLEFVYWWDKLKF